MAKNFKFLNRAMQVILSGSLIVGLFFIVSCDEGGEEKPETLAGKYTFKKATLESNLVFDLDGGGTFTLPVAGTDITDQMESSLLEEAPCDNPDNGAVELKPSKELYFTCIGEDNDASAGTWDENDELTELTLNLVLSVQNFSLVVKELTKTSNTLGGKISNFPLTQEMIEPMLDLLPIKPEGIIVPATMLIDVEVTFNRVG